VNDMYTLLFLLFFSFNFANGDGGSGIDPEGGRLRGSGVCIDPDGGRCARSLGDDGSGLDPHGGRVTGQGDGGPHMDPNG
jgi:hypothetical protein